MTELRAVTGIGGESAAALSDIGITSAEELAGASVADVREADGFGPARAEAVIDNAGEAVDVAEVTPETSATVADESASATETETGTAETTESEYTITFEDYSLQTFFHAVHVVSEEATSRYQTNETSILDPTYRVANKLIDAYRAVATETETPIREDGESYTITLSVTAAEVESLYRALRAGSSDYASRSGIRNMYGQFDQMVGTVDELRREIRSRN